MHSNKAEAIRDFLSAGLKTQLLVSLLVPVFVVSLVWAVNKANEHFSRKLPKDSQPKEVPLRVYRNCLIVLFAVMIALTVYSNLTR